MSLLQSIVGELDRALARLHALRELVSELGQVPAVEAQISSSLDIVPTSSESVFAAGLQLAQPAKPKCRVRADAGKPRGRRAAKPGLPPEPRAFGKIVPSGPVVFILTQLAEEKAKRAQAKRLLTFATPEDLDALTRSLSARWSAGLVAVGLLHFEKMSSPQSTKHLLQIVVAGVGRLLWWFDRGLGADKVILHDHGQTSRLSSMPTTVSARISSRPVASVRDFCRCLDIGRLAETT